MEIAARFARDGDEEARGVFHEAFARNVRETPTVKGEQALLNMDGLDGYRRAAQLLAANPNADRGEWVETGLMRDAFERFVRAAVMKLGRNDPNLDTYLIHTEGKKRTQRAEMRRDVPLPSDPELKRIIELPQGQEQLHWSWGRKLLPQQVRQLLQDMANEDDPVRLRRYLRLFRHTRVPFDPALVIRLTRSEVHGVARGALAVLKRISHPDVRKLGEELTSDLTDADRTGDGLELLAANPRDGDWDVIAAALEQAALRGSKLCTT